MLTRLCACPACLPHNTKLEASITTDFPSLLGLASPVVGKYEDASTPSQLAEKPKLLATAQPQNGTVVSAALHACPPGLTPAPRHQPRHAAVPHTLLALCSKVSSGHRPSSSP
jgi:hypothetical protein